MFETRPKDHWVATSRAVNAAQATASAVKGATRVVEKGRNVVGALMACWMAFIFAFGALGTMVSARSTGQALFALILGGAICAAFVYAAKRMWRKARSE